MIGFHALHYLVSQEASSTLDDVLRHIAHISNVGGVDCVGIGPDLMENWDESIMKDVYDRSTTINAVPVGKIKFEYPKGMSSVADLPNLTEGLLKLGFANGDVEKILGGNLMRLFEAVWKPTPNRHIP